MYEARAQHFSQLDELRFVAVEFLQCLRYSGIYIKTKVSYQYCGITIAGSIADEIGPKIHMIERLHHKKAMKKRKKLRKKTLNQWIQTSDLKIGSPLPYRAIITYVGNTKRLCALTQIAWGVGAY